MNKLVCIATACLLTTAVGCGKSKSKSKSKDDNKPKATGKHTCQNVVDHIYPILKQFRKSDKSAYGKMAKNIDESPAAVKKRKANQVRTCEQRKYTPEEKHCYMTSKSVADIESCSKIWRERSQAANGAAKKKPPANMSTKTPADDSAAKNKTKPADGSAAKKPADGKPAGKK